MTKKDGIRQFAIDIETIPNMDLVAGLPEIEVKYGNTKDPDKRAILEEEAKAKQISNMGLYPQTGRICSCAIYGDGFSDSATIAATTEAEEILLVEWILSKLNSQSEIITWNGFDFDIPYIYFRAWALRVDPSGCMPRSYWTKRYTNFPHCDMMKEANGWKERMDGFSLDWISGNILGERKNKRDYSTYIDLINSGRSNEIAVDNMVDARLTFKLFQSAQPYFF